MRLRKHNGTYYAKLANRQSVNLKTASLKDARRLAKEAKLEEIEFAAKAGILSVEAMQRMQVGHVTFARAHMLWVDWALLQFAPSTVRSYREWMETFPAPKEISEVTESDVDAWVNSGDHSLATRRLKYAAIHCFFRFCLARGYAIVNPVDLTRVRMEGLSFEQKEAKTRVPFTPAEVLTLRRYLDECGEDFWSAAVLLADRYGLRLGDVVELEWASFEKPGSVIVWSDKRDRRIDLPSDPEVEHMLGGLMREDPEFVFPKESAIPRNNLSARFINLAKRAGFPGRSFHCLRHGFATRMAALGEDIDTIRLRMGHTSAETTKQYIHA